MMLQKVWRMETSTQVLGRTSFLLLLGVQMAEHAKLFCSETRVILMQDLKRKGIPSPSSLSTMSLTSRSHIHTRHIVLEYVLLV